jgi:hypothetical protein
VLIQSLLLLSYSTASSDGFRNAWYWIGVAAAEIYRMKLHKQNNMHSMSPAERGLARRLWWAFCIRDRLLAAEYRRPVHIELRDCQVPLLSLEDFDLDPGVIGQRRTSSEFSHSARTFIEMTKLCLAATGNHMDYVGVGERTPMSGYSSCSSPEV